MAYSPSWIVLKLARAKQHLDAVNEETRQLVDSKDCGVVVDFETEPGYLIIKAYMRRTPPPLCSIYIGEALYQIRSALDHLICYLTEKNGKVVNNKREFPIFSDRDHFRDPKTGALCSWILDRIDGLTPQHQALVEREQPFQGKYGAPDDDPLRWLYCLSNFDRHQFLHLVGTTVVSAHDIFTPQWFADRYLTQITSNFGPFEGETEVARFRIAAAAHDLTPEVAVQVNSKVSFSVAFDQNGPGLGRPVISTLKAIGERATLILAEFVK